RPTLQRKVWHGSVKSRQGLPLVWPVWPLPPLGAIRSSSLTRRKRFFGGSLRCSEACCSWSWCGFMGNLPLGNATEHQTHKRPGLMQARLQTDSHLKSAVGSVARMIETANRATTVRRIPLRGDALLQLDEAEALRSGVLLRLRGLGLIVLAWFHWG